MMRARALARITRESDRSVSSGKFGTKSDRDPRKEAARFIVLIGALFPTMRGFVDTADRPVFSGSYRTLSADDKSTIRSISSAVHVCTIMQRERERAGYPCSREQRTIRRMKALFGSPRGDFTFARFPHNARRNKPRTISSFGRIKALDFFLLFSSRQAQLPVKCSSFPLRSPSRLR